MNERDELEAKVAHRLRVAQAVLSTSAEQLHGHDAERSAALAAEAERVAALVHNPPRITRRGAWGT